MGRKLFTILLLVLILPLLVIGAFQIQNYLSRAASTPANLEINAHEVGGPVTRPWAAYAQGGEETEKVFTNLVPRMRELSPRYIRIDHIYDFYDVVKKTDLGFEYDFSKLDKTIDEITAMGALPFFSLSYMPKIFTPSQSVIDKPSDWSLWKDLVTKTIDHYSGRSQKNLTNVYYEVWNEPELSQFGSYSIKGTDKDYRLLYFYASEGAKQAQNVNSFSFGGPAVGSFYSDWVTEFLNYVESNSLRLDFYSWHRYNKSSTKIKEDAHAIRALLQRYKNFSGLPLILTEWSFDSENVESNNSKLAGAFAIAAIAEFESDVTLAFHFEVKNGPPPQGGQWGLFTHEMDWPSLSAKIPFYAFKALEDLKGSKVEVKGNGTYVKALAAKSSDTIKVVLANYDPSEKNAQNVPIRFVNIDNGTYEVTTEYVYEKATLRTSEVVLQKSFQKMIPILPSQIVIVTITKNGEIAQFSKGKDNILNANDQGFSLQSGSLSFAKPDFSLSKSGSISFDLKPSANLPDSYYIFNTPFATSSGTINRLFLAKQKLGGIGAIKFGVGTGSHENYSVLIPASVLVTDAWNHIVTSWSSTQLILEINGVKSQSVPMNLTIDNGTVLNFEELDAVLDNLETKSGSTSLIRKFDGDKIH